MIFGFLWSGDGARGVKPAQPRGWESAYETQMGKSRAWLPGTTYEGEKCSPRRASSRADCCASRRWWAIRDSPNERLQGGGGGRSHKQSLIPCCQLGDRGKNTRYWLSHARGASWLGLLHQEGCRGCSRVASPHMLKEFLAAPQPPDVILG